MGKHSKRLQGGSSTSLEASPNLNDLRNPPGNRLETLKGNRAGQYSIRIDDQYRIYFVWKVDGAYEIEITDYH